jgi:hypothetical protein
MRLKHLTAFVAASLVGLCLTLTAQASPRFTIENASDDKIKVYIYNGDDTSCTEEAKTKKVSPGITETYGCTGNGKGKCKVQFYFDIDQICTKERNTCSGKAIKLDGGSKTKISWNGSKFVCDID